MHRQFGLAVIEADIGEGWSTADHLAYELPASIAAIDGRIDNARALGPSTDSLSDAQLLLEAYSRWGTECGAHLVGDFAFVVWDERSKRLLCARDPLGVRPFYYQLTGQTLRFGSQIASVVHNNSDDAYDMDFLADYSVSGLSLTDSTPFRGVRQLPPGHSLIVENGGVTIEQYWDFCTTPDMPPKDYVDRFLELFREGLQCGIGDDATVWAELSGGLDSSSIVAVAHRLFEDKGRQLSTITFGFDEAKLSDERSWSQLVLEQYKTQAHFISGDTYYPFRNFQVGASYWDIPHAQIIFYSLFHQYGEILTMTDSNILLSGIGAEAVVMGKVATPIHLAGLLQRLELRKLWKELHKWQPSLQIPTINVLLDYCLDPLVHPNKVEYGSIRYSIPDWVERDFAQKEDLTERCMRGHRSRRFRNPADQWQYEKLGRISAFLYRGYLEKFCPIRYPFLYRPLLEFVMAVPWEEKFRPGEMKSLLVRAMKGILPETVRTRTQNTSTGHAAYLGLRREWPRIEAMTNKTILSELGIVNPKKFRNAVELARSGHAADFHVLVSTLALEAWLQARLKVKEVPERTTNRNARSSVFTA